MFSKILIANRGEIAVRIIRTCRRLGIATVMVYSDADAGSLAVEMADEAVRLGPAAAAESYLRQDLIIRAAKDTGAEAVHPGFGFLAENAGFARALAAEGIVFIGPTPEAIAAMGDKIESKKLAQKAGVSTVPGHVGTVDNAEQAAEVARAIGYPVMIKASAGGGGKGMRIAWNDQEVVDGLRSAANEARNSFGDDRVFVEKFVEEPRHIEIQVLADAHGHCIYLGERECSVQRRHQKVVEEAPSPALDAATRAAMGEQAVALAQAVGYRSAGTVEFIVDPQRNFYFLEMNTRLQVEHPVTEMVTGLDLVEEMIRVALGEKLRLRQEDVKLNGWSMEVRVYAEDPRRGFVPSIGRLSRYRPPETSEHVRIDSGVVEGSEISMYYDPMIAKLVTWGETRDAAIDEMRAALDSFHVRGISHNIGFLGAIMASERFRAGRLSTGFIAEEFPEGYAETALASANADVLVPVAAAIHRRIQERDATLSGQLPGHRRRVPDAWVVVLDHDDHRPVRVRPAAEGGWDVAMDGRVVVVQADWEPGTPLFQGTVGGAQVAVQVERKGVGYVLSTGGSIVPVSVFTPRAAELAKLMPKREAADTGKVLLSPMPGLLVAVAVEVGWEVKVGQELAVVEAMKMENVLRAERDGVVKAIPVAAGDSLAADQVIIEFE